MPRPDPRGSGRNPAQNHASGRGGPGGRDPGPGETGNFYRVKMTSAGGSDGADGDAPLPWPLAQAVPFGYDTFAMAQPTPTV